MKRWLAMGLVIPGVLLIAACGGNGEKKANVVNVDAKDFSYAMPDEVPGGRITFNVHNDGTYLHEFAFARLEDGKTIDDVKALLESGSEEPPSWMEDIAACP